MTNHDDGYFTMHTVNVKYTECRSQLLIILPSMHCRQVYKESWLFHDGSGD